MKVSIDQKQIFTKFYAQNQAKYISERIAKNVFDLQPEELAHQIVDNLYTFCPCVFKEVDGVLKRKNSNFAEQQYFAIDVDNQIKVKKGGKPVPIPEPLLVQEAIELCLTFRIPPVFIYNSLSDNGRNRKYRVLWATAEPIFNKQLRDIITQCLIKIFACSKKDCVDSSCKDAARLFFPGRDIPYNNYDSRLDIETLLISTSKAIHDADPNNAHRNKIRFWSRIGLAHIDGEPRIELENEQKGKEVSEITIIKSISDSPETIHLRYIYLNDILHGGKKKSPTLIVNLEDRSNKIEHFDFHELEENCQLYNEFINSTEHIDHYNNMRIFTNLMCIKGGLSKIKQGLQHRVDCGFENQSWMEYWLYDVEYFLFRYFPIRCTEGSSSSCPHSQICNHQLNMIRTAQINKRRIKDYVVRDTISRNEGIERLKTILKAVSS